MPLENLRTVKQIVERNPEVLTEAVVRWWIFNAEQNGLGMAVVRIGRRVYIDQPEFDAWITSQRASPPWSTGRR